MRLSAPAVIASGIIAWGASAGAQSGDGARAGFALDRFTISERGSDWFALDSLDLRGDLRLAVGIAADYAHRPLVLYVVGGNESRSDLVARQLVSHLGASLVLRDRVRVAVDFPFVLAQAGETSDLADGAFAPPSTMAAGDLRLGADLRLFGGYQEPAELAIGAQLHAPTGSRSSFAGDGKARLALHAQAAGQVGALAWALQAGYLVRGQDAPIDGHPYGDELFAAAAAGVRVVHGRVLLGAEAFGSSVVSGGELLESSATPVELLFGAHARLPGDWRAALGVGPGMGRAPGTPSWRAVASIEWAPAPPSRPRAAPPPPPEPVAVAPPPPEPEPTRAPEPAPEPAPAPAPAPESDDQIHLREQVKFKTGSDKILEVSEPTLRAVVQVMEQHPEITHVTVQGHTDNVGSQTLNERLSVRRARAVVSWLVAHGIAEQRLSFQGFGMTAPIDSNATEEGRQNNRRVELHIDEQVKP